MKTLPAKAAATNALPAILPESEYSLLPGEVNAAPWAYAPADPSVLTLDQDILKGLAMKAMALGDGRLTAVGVAGLQHGAGATTVARNLAICLAAQFGKRVVLVEANQRSPSLRRLYGLPDSPGLSDVLAQAASLGASLQIAGEDARILMLPASVKQATILTADGLRAVLGTLFGHADAVVVDMAPVIPYRDTAALCAALDGVALVLRGGASTLKDGRAAVARITDAGTPVLGAVLNREKRVVPGFLERWLGLRAA
jgi:Mrp family chromosome partitioning ATPase